MAASPTLPAPQTPAVETDSTPPAAAPRGEPAAPPAIAPPTAAPPLEIRDDRPMDPRWHGDLLAPSTHGRLVSAAVPAAVEAATPVAVADPGDGSPQQERLDAHCATTARELLGDFAPALLLLPSTERARVRTLLAFAGALLACAVRPGFDGERLTHINRWEAALERAMAGGAGLPPLCARMAHENTRRRWPADALDELIACARRRALHPRPATAANAEAEARSLARAVVGALLEGRLNAEVSGFVGALIRLRALQGLGAALARGDCPWPEDEYRETSELEEAIGRECARLRPPLLRAPRGLLELPTAYRRAGVFSLLAALRLLSEIEDDAPRLAAAPPHLGMATRIGLLARARWFGLRIGPSKYRRDAGLRPRR
jgi:hypothetical protein